MPDDVDDKLFLDGTALAEAPMILTPQENQTIAKAAIDAWKRELAARPGSMQRALDKVRERKQALKRKDGLSDTGELQFALMIPSYVENLISIIVKDGDWPRSRPGLLAAVADEFQVGIMGEYGADVHGAGTNARRDFGCAMGSGDRD